jgi:hypothetical protein
MSERLSAAMKFCEKRKQELPKKQRTIFPMGGKQHHGKLDGLLWKLQQTLDKLNETINEKWQ